MTNTNRHIITIEAHELPNNKFSIGLVEPLFKEKRLAVKRMPTANSGEKVGYTTTQLLLAMCIKEVNGQSVDKYTNAADPVSILRNLRTDDTQYLTATFISAFTLDRELAEDVNEFSTELKKNNSTPYFTIPKEKLPNQYGDIIFRRPTTHDEILVQRKYPGEGANPGYTVNEMFFAECITSINGVEVQKSNYPEIISLLDDWTLIDQQYALAVFSNVSYMDETDQDKAQELGKNLRGKLKNLKPTTSKPEKEVTSTTK